MTSGKPKATSRFQASEEDTKIFEILLLPCLRQLLLIETLMEMNYNEEVKKKMAVSESVNIKPCVIRYTRCGFNIILLN